MPAGDESLKHSSGIWTGSAVPDKPGFPSIPGNRNKHYLYSSMAMARGHKMNVCLYLTCLLSVFLFGGSVSAEVTTNTEDQRDISLTVYSSDLALVRDVRSLTLAAGEQRLAFKGISSKIQPETALLTGTDIKVLEQNYEFDLLSPETLLQKYVGRKVTLVRTSDGKGEEQHLQARVLSTSGGVVLQVEDHIETGIDGRIIFPDVPDNLREKPTLTMEVESGVAGSRDVQLTYLSRGISWRADYVAELNSAEDRIDLKGWVTLTNGSGTDYRNATLQLIAGEVHRVQPERELMALAMEDGAPGRQAGKREAMSRESLFEYHLYGLERPTTLLDNQSKQIALLQEENGKCRKKLLLHSRNPGYYWSKVGDISKGESVDVLLIMKNDKPSNLGAPKPAGTVRVYKKDGSGLLQFVGEDRIGHTPENEWIKITMGESFDVTADRVQKDFRIIDSGKQGERVTESEYSITLKNAKDENVEVTVEEYVPGDWRILDESHPHVKMSATTISWNVEVSAKDSSTLTYRLRTRRQ